jgi:hypothetical protein
MAAVKGDGQGKKAQDQHLLQQNAARLPDQPVKAPDPWPEGAHTFVQFDGVVVVHDSRGVEQLTDRAALGNPLGDHGLSVMSIILDGDWFEVTAMGRVLGSDVARTYRVPLTNVRSARR